MADPPDDPANDPPAADALGEDVEDRLLVATIERRLGDRDRRALLHRLATANRPARRDAVRGEIELVLRFLDLGATVGTEAGDPGESPVDIRVTLDRVSFAVHVKRVGAVPPAPASVPESLRTLSAVPRPYVVGVEGARDPIEPGLVEEVRQFLLSARLGDRFLLRDEHDRTAGSVKVLAPTGRPDAGVELRPMGHPPAEAAWIDRATRHLRRAYRQFVGGTENVIALVGGGPEAGSLVDLALLGQHVERWDRLPRIGQRVAHGRDDRGLWTERRYDRSRLVAWCPLGGGAGRTWRRDGTHVHEDVEAAVREAVAASLSGDEG